MGHPIGALAFATAWLIACGQAGGPGATIATPTGASETRSGSPTLAPATEVLLPGTIVRATVPADIPSVFADGGKLFAISTRDGPAPFLSTIQRYDAAAGVWQKVFEDDAHFLSARPDAGRLALIEYREVLQGGGANDQRIVVVDLGSGATTKIDAYALSAATFHGGGGGPRRPGPRAVLGGDMVVWTRLNELPGGDTEGEMRIAKLSDRAHFTTLGRSREWIEPLWIDGATLVYLVGGAQQDEIRSRDLSTGAERSVAKLRAPGQSAGRAGLTRSGRIIGWIDNPPLPGAPDAKPGDPTTSTLHTMQLDTGVARDLDLGASYCVALSGNAIGFVWTCPPTTQPVTTLSYFDPRAWRSADLIRSPDRPNSVEAFDNAFVWFEVVNGARRVTLLTPAP